MLSCCLFLQFNDQEEVELSSNMPFSCLVQIDHLINSQDSVSNGVLTGTSRSCVTSHLKPCQGCSCCQIGDITNHYS